MIFQSVADSYRSNGDRHLANAREHLRNDNVKFAIGSLKKAIRNYERYQTQVDFDNDIPKIIKDCMSLMVDNISNQIMNGSANGETNFTRTISK